MSETTAKQRRAKDPAIPGAAGVVIAFIPERYRPTATFAVVCGIVIAGSFWLDARARGYVERAAAATVTTVVAEHTKATDAAVAVNTTRISTVEASVSELREQLNTISATVARTEGKVDTVISQINRRR